MNNIPKRKHIRIEDYDYSTPGAYFITVCVNDRKPILWNVGAATFSRVTWYPPVQGHGIQLTSLQWNGGSDVHQAYQIPQF